jgi:hypothetical protein
VGAIIVTDLETPGGHPKPTEIRTTPAFLSLLEQVRNAALDADNRQRLQRFNLTHHDALWPAPRSAAEVNTTEESADV